MGNLSAVMGDSGLRGTGQEINGTVMDRISLIKNSPIEWPVPPSPPTPARMSLRNDMETRPVCKPCGEDLIIRPGVPKADMKRALL